MWSDIGASISAYLQVPMCDIFVGQPHGGREFLGDGDVQVVAQRTAVIEAIGAVEDVLGCLQVGPVGHADLRWEGGAGEMDWQT